MMMDSKKTYGCLFVLMMVNNWWGDLKVFSGIYFLVRPAVLSVSAMIAFGIAIRKKYAVAELLLCIFLVMIGGYTSYVTESKWILYLTVLIALVKETDTKSILVVAYRSMSVFLLISMSVFIIQVVGSPDMLGTISYNGITKYDMNFIGANEAARYWIYWVLLSRCMDTKRTISIFNAILVAFGTVFFYLCTRSEALLIVPGILFLKYIERYKKCERFVQRAGGYSFLSICICSVLILRLNGTGLFALADQFCSGRLSLGIAAFREYGTTFLGRTPLRFYHWINAGTDNALRLVVDNAYHMIMIQYGIIYLMIISFIFIKASKKCSYRENICFIVYSIFALAENVIFSPTAIFPVLIAASACWGTGREKHIDRPEEDRTGMEHKMLGEEGGCFAR